MSSSIRSLISIAMLLALGANGCSRDVRPVAAARSPVECEGGVVHRASDAARFEGCQTIVGDLRIVGTDLKQLSAFEQVRIVSGSVAITDNPKLVSVSGLKGLESARAVEIRNNPVLCGYFGVLPRLEHVASPLVLRANRGLSQRDVRQLLEHVAVRAPGDDSRQALLQ
jgi:hypothetical protein